MRYIRYAFWALVGIALVVIGLANRDMVTLDLMPADMGRLLGMDYSLTVPLFAVIFGSVVAGLLIGFVWEWLREHKQRAEARRRERELHRLQREVRRLKGEKHQGKDEALALLDEAG